MIRTKCNYCKRYFEEYDIINEVCCKQCHKDLKKENIDLKNKIKELEKEIDYWKDHVNFITKDMQ